LGYKGIQGTSMASPAVAGVAALVKARAPQITGPAIRQAIMNSVELAEAFEGKTVTGGIVNAAKALGEVKPEWLTMLSEGRLNIKPGERKTIRILIKGESIESSESAELIVSERGEKSALARLQIEAKRAVFQTAAASVPSAPAPAGLKLTSKPNENIGLSWNAVNFATKYKVYRSDSSSGPFEVLGSSDELFFVDKTAIAEVGYFYAVTSVVDGSESQRSSLVYAKRTEQVSDLIVKIDNADINALKLGEARTVYVSALNDGPKSARDIRMSISKPVNASVSVKSNRYSCGDVEEKVVCEVGALASGEVSGKVEVTFTGKTEGISLSTFNIRGDYESYDPVSDNNSGLIEFSVTGRADLSIEAVAQDVNGK